MVYWSWSEYQLQIRLDIDIRRIRFARLGRSSPSLRTVQQERETALASLLREPSRADRRRARRPGSARGGPCGELRVIRRRRSPRQSGWSTKTFCPWPHDDSPSSSARQAPPPASMPAVTRARAATAIDSSPGVRSEPLRARPRPLVAAPDRSRGPRRLRHGPRSAITTSPPSPRPRPTTSTSSATIPAAAWDAAWRPPHLRDHRRRLHAQHGPTGSRSTVLVAVSSSPCTVRIPARRRAQPENPGRRIRCRAGPCIRRSMPLRAPPRIAGRVRVLLTNDDGISAPGLQAARRALREIDGVEVDVIAPDSNRSATARSITTRSPLTRRGGRVRRRRRGLRDRRHAGRLRALRRARPGRRPARPDRLRDQPRRQPRRRHHLLGHGRRRLRGDRPRDPGASRVSQQSSGGGMGYVSGRFDFGVAAAFTAAAGRRLLAEPMPAATLINVNCPAGEPEGSR